MFTLFAVTPIDPAKIQVEMDLSQSQNRGNVNHRFQGYPDHSFNSSRRPIMGLVEWEGPDKSYKRAQHFVKGNINKKHIFMCL